MAGLPADRIHRVGKERGREEREDREDGAVTERRTGQRRRKGSCVYDLSTSLQRGKVGRYRSVPLPEPVSPERKANG